MPFDTLTTFRLVHSEVVSAVGRTFSPLVSDTRHIGDAAHLWAGFVRIAPLTATLCRLHRAFDHEVVAHFKANRSISVGVSRRYPFIPPIGLSVLLRFQAIKPFDLVPNLFS